MQSDSDAAAGQVERQPLLPQIRLKWTFAAVTAAAVLTALVRMADQDAALVSAIVAIAAWVAALFSMFGVLFLITYALGALENLLAPPQDEVLSPFAGERLPEQIVVPAKTDAQ
jgi:hypothetical protein